MLACYSLFLFLFDMRKQKNGTSEYVMEGSLAGLCLLNDYLVNKNAFILISINAHCQIVYIQEFVIIWTFILCRRGITALWKFFKMFYNLLPHKCKMLKNE